MRKIYKNQKEKFRIEAEANLRQANFWKEEVEKKNQIINNLRKQKNEKVEVIFFCMRCRTVGKGTIDKGVDMETCQCPACGARELKSVSRIKGTFIE